MTTTVVKTIGTGGDYSTPQAWEDACPANLVTVDQIWQGQCLKQTFTASTGAYCLQMAGVTTSASCYMDLTTAPGCAWRDDPSVRSNAYRYDTSKGAAFESSEDFKAVLLCSTNFTRISNLQFSRNTSTTATSAVDCAGISGTATIDVNNCIIENDVGANNNGALRLFGSNSVVRNTLVVMRGASQTTIAFIANGAQARNVTFAATSGSCTYAVQGSYGATTFQNCGFFGGSNVWSGGATPTFTTCATDSVLPPTGCTNVTNSTSVGTKFFNISDGTHDYRLQSGSALIDAGTTDATNAAFDASGMARPQGSAYDIGAWEYAAAAASTGYARGRVVNRGGIGSAYVRGNLVN